MAVADRRGRGRRRPPQAPQQRRLSDPPAPLVPDGFANRFFGLRSLVDWETHPARPERPPTPSRGRMARRWNATGGRERRTHTSSSPSSHTSHTPRPQASPRAGHDHIRHTSNLFPRLPLPPAPPSRVHTLPTTRTNNPRPRPNLGPARRDPAGGLMITGRGPVPDHPRTPNHARHHTHPGPFGGRGPTPFFGVGPAARADGPSSTQDQRSPDREKRMRPGPLVCARRPGVCASSPRCTWRVSRARSDPGTGHPSALDDGPRPGTPHNRAPPTDGQQPSQKQRFFACPALKTRLRRRRSLVPLSPERGVG